MEGIPEFNPMDFKILKKLGRGSFGSVKLVENKKTHKQYAAKEQYNESEDSFQKEIKTYKKTNNAAILSLLGYSPKNFKLEGKLTLFTEYMKNGSVTKMFKKPKTAKNNLMKYIILLGVSLGMKYLHSEGIIHRDLKADNIVLNDEMEPKICDFGSSKISDKEFTEILMNNSKGTPLYMPPEILGSHDPYNYKVDVYAFSFFAYELITGKTAFYEVKNLTRSILRKMVVKGDRPNISIIKDDTIKNFLEKCWAQRPSDRPSFLEIVDELMQDKFKKAFGIVDQKDIEKVENYLKLFDEDLKSPNSKDALDVKKEADKGNIDAILQYHHMLLTGYGAVMNKKEALKYLKKVSDLNDINATYLYAYCLRHGEGTEKNMNEAIKYYKKAASLGNPIAMINLGDMYRFGSEIPQNYNEAVKYYEQSASLGNTNALINLGYMMYHGEGIPTDKEKGKFYLKRAADSGNNQAMYIYGKILLDENENMQAMVYLRMSAELGNVDAMRLYSFTKMYSNGFNYTDPELMRYLRMAANHGDALSEEMCKIGLGDVEEYAEETAQEIKEEADDGDIQSMISYAKMCYSGEGVELNKKEAARYYEKAAELGESQAMFEFGKMLVNGDGIPENKKKGMQYLQQSVIKQDINVMYSYGQLLRNGEGIPTDKIEGANFLKKSAERGNTKAMFAYGQMLYAGEGIPKNQEEGLKLIEKSTLVDKDMMVEYGKMLQKGEIVPVNKKLAFNYYKKAVGLADFRAMYYLGLMEIAGDGIEMNRDDGIRLLKLSADHGFIDSMKAYAGILINSIDKDKKKEAANYIKNASEKGDKVSFFLFKHVFRQFLYSSENESSISNKNEKEERNEKDTNSPIIKVNSYESNIFENNQFIFLQNSTIPQKISDEFLEKLQKSNTFRGVQRNVIHQNDPNSTYTFYFFSSMDPGLVLNILIQLSQKINVQFVMTQWNIDMFFNEKIIPPDVLNVLLNHLNGLKNIRGVNRNIFDGRQIATYILVNPILNNTKEINESIHNLLLPKGMVFDKIRYPLEKNIIINEELILKGKKDFDVIISEIKKIGLNPINIERNRLYLYGNYFIRKLFQTFSFICFNTENEKMEALNHINSLVYSSKRNVLKYKMDLHYAKIDDSPYPKNVRDNLYSLFQSFKGIKDIQEHVFSIENPIARTYVGFDSIKHLKKAYNKFFHYVDTLKYGINPKIFLKKKNLIYLYVEGKIDERIETIISNYFAADVQKDCTEYNGNRFHRNYSKLIKLNFFGFNGKDNYDKALNLLENNSIQYFRYHEIKSFINSVSDVPEEYLFYESF